MPDRSGNRKRSVNQRPDEQLRLLSSAIEQTGEGIAIVDTGGSLQYINSAFANMHGYEPDELRGKSLGVLHTSDQMKRVEEFVENASGARFIEGQVNHVRRDGTAFPGLMRSTLLRDESGEVIGMLITLRDISEQKRAEQELRDTHEQLRATLEALPDLLFETDREGRIYYFHAPDPRLLYRAPEEFIGKMVQEVLPKEPVEVIMDAVRATVEKGSSLGATYSLDIANERMWFELSLVAKGDLSTAQGRVVALVRNITDRKRNEEKLKKMTADLEAERRELTEKNIALKQILDHLEEQRKSFRREMWRNVEQSLMPLVKKLRLELKPGHTGEIESLVAALEMLLSENGDDFERRYGRLTSRESEICELIKQGMSSKQITETLKLSLLTVHKHREQIRRKLGIANLDISLATYLRYH